MYLHIGGETVIPEKDLIAIYDLDRTTLSVDTREFLAFAQRGGLIIEASPELPKAFVITGDEDGVQRVYLSPLSTSTLMKRLYNKE